MQVQIVASRYLEFAKLRKFKHLKTIFLELGSGPKKGQNGWITIDLVGADLSYDLRNGIPFLSDSVDHIYTSHMLEHIPYRELLIFLNECHRVLKDGGELSVCVPNSGYYVKAYSKGLYFKETGKGYGPAVVDTGSLLDQVNYIAYMNKMHNYMFDEENLVNALKKVPFSSVALRGFDSSVDLESRDYESIYAVAIKQLLHFTCLVFNCILFFDVSASNITSRQCFLFCGFCSSILAW